MKAYFEKLYNQVSQAIDTIESEFHCPIERAERSSSVVRECIEKLKEYVSKTGFENNEEEITFFKEIKPKFFALLILYVKLYDIHTRMPIPIKEQRKLLKKELEKIHQYFDDQQEFYRYYRQRGSYMDESYFLRDRYDIKLLPDISYLDSDTTFRTSKDYQVAKIMAFDLLNDKLSTLLKDLEYQAGKDGPEISLASLPWTDTKAGLIEILYGLQCMGSLNNANAGLTQIARLLESAFQVSLGNYSRGFQEMSIRKKSRTPFLDRMREMVIKRMDEIV